MPSITNKILDNIIPSRKRERRNLANANRLEAFLRALPLEYCGWNQQLTQAISANFVRLFDIDHIKTIDDVLVALEKDDAVKLEHAFYNLVENAQEFILTLKVPATQKTLRINGRRGSLADGEEIFNVLWAFDITEYSDKITQTLTSLEALETKEEEFRAALNFLPVPVWIKDKDLNLVWANEAYCKIIGKDLEDIVAQQLDFPLIVPNEDNRDLKVLSQRAQAQNRKQSQTGFVLADGKRTRTDVIVIPGKDGETVGCAIDLNRVEELETEIRQLQSSNYQVLEQLNTAIAIFNKDKNLEFYNSTYEQLWHLNGQWLNKNPKLNDIFDKLRENRRIPEQANFLKFKQEWDEKFTSLIEPEENILYLPDETMLRMVVVPRPEGGLLITYEDVTSRIALETSYNTLLAVQRATLDNLAEGLAVVGGDGLIKLSNPTFYTMWDFEAPPAHAEEKVSEFFDRTKKLFKANEWDERRKELIKSCMERGGSEGRVNLKDGRIYAYRSITLPDGNILVTFTDITDTVKVEQALIEKNAALEAAEKLKMDFLANVSYQLRTPLNAIMGFSEILHEEYFGKLNERQKSYTENMIRAGHRLINLVDNILDLSTIEAGYLLLNKEKIDITETIDNVISLTEDWARREGIEIDKKIPKTVGSLEADPRRFKQVMLHLIRNAIDYTPSGGEIKISAKKQKEDVLIIIEDNGVGIPAEDLERIFIPFEKSENKNKQPKTEQGQSNRHSGAGLGLSLVKHIVELHGGDVTITSEENKGTKVTCRYPRK